MDDVWKSIDGYEGFYEVSYSGHVRSVNRVLSCGRHVKGVVLKECGNPYLQVTLAKNGKAINYLIHGLVARAFIDNPDNLPCVNHRDENKHNNRADNLEWCTYGYNMEYSQVSKKAADARRGKPLSDAHKQAMSKTLKASGAKRAYKRKLTMAERYPDGFKHTDDAKLKVHLKLTGLTRSEETKQKMRKPKSESHIEHMKEAQRLSHKARKLGMTYKEYKEMMKP